MLFIGPRAREAYDMVDEADTIQVNDLDSVFRRIRQLLGAPYNSAEYRRQLRSLP